MYHDSVSYIDREGARSSKFATCSCIAIWVELYLVADLCPFLVQSCNESVVVQEFELYCHAVLIRLCVGGHTDVPSPWWFGKIV